MRPTNHTERTEHVEERKPAEEARPTNEKPANDMPRFHENNLKENVDNNNRERQKSDKKMEIRHNEKPAAEQPATKGGAACKC